MGIALTSDVAATPTPLPAASGSLPPSIGRDIRELILRRAWYRYDFTDAENRPSWLAAFVAGATATNWVPEYEAALARVLRGHEAIAFGAGRMALFAILEALEIGEGDEVIMPAYTCVVVPNAVLYRRARPVFVDVRRDDFNLDVDLLERSITRRTRAILAQHTFGQPCRIDAICDVARRHGLTVIEDVAHAVGGTAGGRPLGTIADVAFGSTDHSKVFSTGLGGFVATRSAELAARIRTVQMRASTLPASARARVALQYAALGVLSRPRLHWLTRMPVEQLTRIGMCFYFLDELQLSRPARYPVRLPNFAAFVGIRELDRLGANIVHRRSVARRYREILLNDHSELGDGAYLRCSVLVRSPGHWERVLSPYFTVGRWFSSVAEGRVSNLESIGYTPGSCPVAESITKQIVNFPTHAAIDRRALDRFETLVRRHRLVDDIVGSAQA